MSERPDAREAIARRLALWIGYSWDSLHDRDISDRSPDWAWDGAGNHHYQGGQPGLLKLADEFIAVASAPFVARELARLEREGQQAK